MNTRPSAWLPPILVAQAGGLHRVRSCPVSSSVTTAGGKALMMGNLLHRDCACDNVESNLTGQLQARILTEPNQYLESGGKRG